MAVRSIPYNGHEGIASTQCLPTVSLGSITLTVDEGSTVDITASLDTAPDGTAAVQLESSGGIGYSGSCFAGDDFAVDSASFVFNNTTTASITLTACDDDDTTDETITFGLSTTGINGLQLGSPTTVVVTITDDDEPQDTDDDGIPDDTDPDDDNDGILDGSDPDHPDYTPPPFLS